MASRADGRSQVLSPSNWLQAKAASALRKQTPVDKSSTFVPLLNWTEDTRGTKELPVVQPAAAVVRCLKPATAAAADTEGASSDASISSSDDDFAAKKPKTRARSPKRTKCDHVKILRTCAPSSFCTAQRHSAFFKDVPLDPFAYCFRLAAQAAQPKPSLLV